MNNVAEDTQSFIDFDAVPDNPATLQEMVNFMLSPRSESLRTSLLPEILEAFDVVSRQLARRSLQQVKEATTIRPPFNIGPTLSIPPPMVFVPTTNKFMRADNFISSAFPALTLEEEIYAQGTLLYAIFKKNCYSCNFQGIEVANIV